MVSQQNGKLTKWQVDTMPSDKMGNRQNLSLKYGKLTKWQVDQIAS